MIRLDVFTGPFLQQVLFGVQTVKLFIESELLSFDPVLFYFITKLLED